MSNLEYWVRFAAVDFGLISLLYASGVREPFWSAEGWVQIACVLAVSYGAVGVRSIGSKRGMDK